MYECYGGVLFYVIENGVFFYDLFVVIDGCVDDLLCVYYLCIYIVVVCDVILCGVDVCGYCVWLLFDNLEWVLGFVKCFGFVYIDFQMLVCMFKVSVCFYVEVIVVYGVNF